MTNLTDKARKVPIKRGDYSKDEIELAVAYVKGEVSYMQIQRILGINNAYQFIAPRIKRAYEKGLIK